MKIVERIKQQYPAEDMLAYTKQALSFDLSFSEAIGDGERLVLDRGVRALALRPDNTDPKLRLTLDRSESALLLTAESTAPDRSYSFSFPADEEQEAAIRWTIYGLVTEARWITELDGHNVRARLFDAEQQILAASLLETVQHWQTAIPKPRKVLTKAVEESTRDFIRQGPVLSRQLIREEVWSAYDYSLRPKRLQGEARSLLRQLYEGDFKKQLERYCGFLRSTEDYREALQNASAAVRKGLHQQPVRNLPNALHTAAEELKAELLEAQGAGGATNAEITLAKLSPDVLEQSLKELDAYYHKQLVLLEREHFLTDLLDAVEGPLGEEITSAIGKLQDVNYELHTFCALPPEGDSDLPKQNIGWDKIVNPDKLQLNIPYTTWDSSRLFRLQLDNTSLIDVWLLSPMLADAASSTQFKSVSFEVPSLSDRTVIRLTTD